MRPLELATAGFRAVSPGTQLFGRLNRARRASSERIWTSANSDTDISSVRTTRKRNAAQQGFVTPLLRTPVPASDPPARSLVCLGRLIPAQNRCVRRNRRPSAGVSSRALTDESKGQARARPVSDRMVGAQGSCARPEDCQWGVEGEDDPPVLLSPDGRLPLCRLDRDGAVSDCGRPPHHGQCRRSLRRLGHRQCRPVLHAAPLVSMGVARPERTPDSGGRGHGDLRSGIKAGLFSVFYWTVISSAYLLRSQRVKNTFVRNS